MKCPNCNSNMFVTDETSTPKSRVTFYRCSLCVGEHVTSMPHQLPTAPTTRSDSYFASAIPPLPGLASAV